MVRNHCISEVISSYNIEYLLEKYDQGFFSMRYCTHNLKDTFQYQKCSFTKHRNFKIVEKNKFNQNSEWLIHFYLDNAIIDRDHFTTQCILY